MGENYQVNLIYLDSNRCGNWDIVNFLKTSTYFCNYNFFLLHKNVKFFFHSRVYSIYIKSDISKQLYHHHKTKPTINSTDVLWYQQLSPFIHENCFLSKMITIRSEFCYKCIDQYRSLPSFTNMKKTRILRFSAYALTIFTEYTAWATFVGHKLEVTKGHFLHEHIN